jgi:uncharacterized protein (DUF1800 family)
MKRFLVAALAVLAIAAAGAGGAPAPEDRAIAHLLNRIAFGPRPGDAERVRAIGLNRYVDEQLHPDRVKDDGVRARLADLTLPRLSPREIVETIEMPQIEARRERKQQANGGDAGNPTAPNPLRQRANAILVELAEQKIVRAVYSERQLQEVLADFWFNHFNVDSRKGRDRFLLPEYERDVIRPRVLGSFRDLLGATAKSPAMLFYLDNWMSADPNGPHAPIRAGRPFDAGRRFQGRRPGEPERPALQNKSRAKKGLNENYARELMELHTLGVDGGYTQKDVTEVARAFTGWTLENPRQGGGFRFDARLHDPGQKVVLGHVIKAGGGESDGEAVLDLLAKHPSTARFIATKLARRFVSDTPPPALVDRAAARFRETGGDLREVMRTILFSTEFRSPDAYAAKVKSPFEFAVSALRAAGTDVAAGAAAAAPAFDAKVLVRRVQQMGMPLYQCQPPTGYGDTAEAWMNSGALVNRINFALEVARGDRQLADALGAPEFQKR